MWLDVPAFFGMMLFPFFSGADGEKNGGTHPCQSQDSRGVCSEYRASILDPSRSPYMVPGLLGSPRKQDQGFDFSNQTGKAATDPSDFLPIQGLDALSGPVLPRRQGGGSGGNYARVGKMTKSTVGFNMITVFPYAPPDF